MPKAKESLSLQEKYALLRKKQSEKQISKNKDKSNKLDANSRLAQLLAKKQMEKEKQSSRSYKLPGTLQNALNSDPKLIIEKQSSSPKQVQNTNFDAYKSQINFRENNDEEYFVQRKSNSENGGTYIDTEGNECYNCTVFIGDITPEANERHLREAFTRFGPILSSRIINMKPYGFVKFKFAEDAKRAITEMNGYLLFGTPIRVSSAKVPAHKQTNRKPFEPQQQREKRNFLDKLPDRDNENVLEDQEYYGHIGEDNTIEERELVTYDDV